MRLLKSRLPLITLIVFPALLPAQKVENILNNWATYEVREEYRHEVECVHTHQRTAALYDAKLTESCRTLQFKQSGYENIAQALEDYRVITFEEIRKQMAPLAKDLHPISPTRREIEMEFRMVHMDSNHISIIAHTRTYGGGAHDAIRHKAFNFKKTDGRWKQFEPLTKHPNPEALREKIRTALNAKDCDGDFFAAHYPQPTAPATRPFEVIELPKQYWLLFEPYVVAPGAFGSIQVGIQKP